MLKLAAGAILAAMLPPPSAFACRACACATCCLVGTGGMAACKHCGTKRQLIVMTHGPTGFISVTASGVPCCWAQLQEPQRTLAAGRQGP